MKQPQDINTHQKLAKELAKKLENISGHGMTSDQKILSSQIWGTLIAISKGRITKSQPVLNEWIRELADSFEDETEYRSEDPESNEPSLNGRQIKIYLVGIVEQLTAAGLAAQSGGLEFRGPNRFAQR